MPIARKLLFVLLAAGLGFSAPATADVPQGARIVPVAAGLEQPWALALLPEGGMLITERDGRLLHIEGDNRREITGLPRVADKGQGGLLDITLARDFAQSRELFLTYAKPQSRGAGTALASARWPEGARQLRDLRDLFVMRAGSKGGRHFGSRVVEARDGTLLMSIGDRGDADSAQDLTRHSGSIIRVNRDGSIPSNNPFVGQSGARPEIWSYGHRNPQGMDIDAQGRVWTSEHGARGGDEVNRITRGTNFGWPVISYGRHYSGFKIGEGTARPGMAQPAFYWDPSIAPSGLLAYDGAMFADWRGALLVGSLKFDHIAVLAGTPLREIARVESRETNRVRDLAQGADGSLWFISVGNGTVYRIERTE